MPRARSIWHIAARRRRGRISSRHVSMDACVSHRMGMRSGTGHRRCTSFHRPEWHHLNLGKGRRMGMRRCMVPRRTVGTRLGDLLRRFGVPHESWTCSDCKCLRVSTSRRAYKVGIPCICPRRRIISSLPPGLRRYREFALLNFGLLSL